MEDHVLWQLFENATATQKQRREELDSAMQVRDAHGALDAEKVNAASERLREANEKWRELQARWDRRTMGGG